MKNIYRRYMMLGVVSMLSVGILGGCSTSNNVAETKTTESGQIQSERKESSQAQSEVQVDAAQYPITVEHAFGTTVIESKPEQIATIAWGNQDVPLALGVVPVGASKANFGVSEDSSLLPWTAQAYKELGVENPVLFDDTDGLNYEAISDVNPDIILCAYSGITQEEYDTLSQIAPVIPYSGNAWQTYWREQTLVEAKAMGVEAEGKALVEDTEALIKEKIAEYGVEGKTAAFFYVNASDLGKFYIYLPQDPRAAYLIDLGLAFPESVTELAKDETGIALTLSAESADQLDDIDVIIAYGDNELLEAMQKDALLGTIPAVQKGAVVLLDSTSSLAASSTPSILSIPDTIDEYLGLIKEALGK
jgi:iron complex transport system substrate-binding protein